MMAATSPATYHKVASARWPAMTYFFKSIHSASHHHQLLLLLRRRNAPRPKRELYIKILHHLQSSTSMHHSPSSRHQNSRPHSQPCLSLECFMFHPPSHCHMLYHYPSTNTLWMLLPPPKRIRFLIRIKTSSVWIYPSSFNSISKRIRLALSIIHTNHHNILAKVMVHGHWYDDAMASYLDAIVLLRGVRLPVIRKLWQCIRLGHGNGPHTRLYAHRKHAIANGYECNKIRPDVITTIL